MSLTIEKKKVLADIRGLHWSEEGLRYGVKLEDMLLFLDGECQGTIGDYDPTANTPEGLKWFMDLLRCLDVGIMMEVNLILINNHLFDLSKTNIEIFNIMCTHQSKVVEAILEAVEEG